MLEELLKLPIYSVCSLSLLIVFHLKKMGFRNLSFLNKMFLVYFSSEAIISFVDGHLLFELIEHRFNINILKAVLK